MHSEVSNEAGEVNKKRGKKRMTAQVLLATRRPVRNILYAKGCRQVLIFTKWTLQKKGERGREKNRIGSQKPITRKGNEILLSIFLLFSVEKYTLCHLRVKN